MLDASARVTAPAIPTRRNRWRRIAGIIRRSPKATARAMRDAAVFGAVQLAWPHTRPSAKAHGLGAPLIISLTSFPPRFATLAATLKCLLSQTIAPDALVLWIAEGDAAKLPDAVRKLARFGLSIETTPDLRSYKKIIPALRRFPGVFIATADDDLYYPPNWLAQMVAAYDPARREIPCHRAHQALLGPNGLPAPYRAWRIDADVRDASPLIFPTTGHGVLYPPGAFHPDVVDEAQFRSLCPSADDVWLYWMARRSGYVFRRIGPRRTLITWPRTQQASLRQINQIGGANDAQICNMIERFGFPMASTP
jgi:hypothetical protein